MAVTAFRVQNFMGFEDSDWIELRPITLLFGRNSSGKSALIRALLLLRQSLESDPGSGALLFVKDDGYDFGDYAELVKDHDTTKDMSFWFKIEFQRRSDAQGEDMYLNLALESINDFIIPASVPVDERPDTQTLTVRLIIGQNTAGSTELKGLDILDQNGKIVLRADKPENGDPGVWTVATDLFELSNPESSFPEVWRSIEIFSQRGFLPWIRPLENIYRQIEEDAFRKIGEGVTTPDEVRFFGEDFQNVWTILRGIRTSLSAFLEKIDYIGPLRASPRRFFYVMGQRAASPERGRNFVRNLVQADAETLESINTWLRAAGMPYRLELQPLDDRKRLYELRLQELSGEQGRHFSANISEVGFGVTQMLPIITQAVLAQPGDTLIIEQPELHLHPRAQAELTDLFIAMSRRGLRFLIETHSEHMLLRVRRRIAETTAGMISDGALTHAKPDRLQAYFIDRLEDGSTAEPIIIDSQGKMSNPPGFRGFFADDLQELASLNLAILGMQDSEAAR
ncbi:MAG: AAA family ATPase [Roseiflexaceae bacterium]|nr:AAA family ATPase [Roseiflexaceae bacterium]